MSTDAASKWDELRLVLDFSTETVRPGTSSLYSGSGGLFIGVLTPFARFTFFCFFVNLMLTDNFK